MLNANAFSTIDPTVFAAAIVTVIAALGGIIVQIINAASAARDRREAAMERQQLMDRTTLALHSSAENGKKADVLIESTAKIHELTNSTNSNLQKALDIASEKISGFERLISQMQMEKAQTASMRATTDQQVASAFNAAPPSNGGTYTSQVVESLDKIDHNTAAIDHNTKESK